MLPFVDFPLTSAGRVFIPEDYKRNKSIIAVCDGEIEILNKLGERITPSSEILNKIPRVDYISK